jgi:hypothetical protein
VNNRELLIAIADLQPIRIQGEFQRHVSLRWDELRPSTAGGRWGASRAFEVLYLGRPKASVVVEAYRHLVDDELDSPVELAAAVVERRLILCDVGVSNVLDLRPEAARSRLGLSEADLKSPIGDYEKCQRIGAAAHQLQLSGLITISASGIGETLALFPTNMAVDEWPRVLRRELWHGLPADPRRLRLADEETK